MNASQAELNNLVGITGKTGSGNIVLSDSPTFTGSLNAEVITASGTVMANLFAGSGASLTSLNASALSNGIVPNARISESSVTQHQAALSIGGAQITSGTVPDARLSSNIPLKDAANTFTNGQTIAFPGLNHLVLDETDAGVNERLFSFRRANGTLTLSTLNDAGAFGANALTINRSGTTVTNITLAATALTLNGAATFSNDISLSGARTIDATTRLNLTGEIVSVGENNGTLGFFGADGTTKRTVSGSGDEVGTLARSIATALQSMGLVTFQTA